MRPPQSTAGWYPNPDGAPGQRYWDGAQWSIIEIPATSVHPSSPAPSADDRSFRRNIWLTLIAAALVVMWAVAFFVFGGSRGERTTGTEAVQPTTTCGAATDRAITDHIGTVGLPAECAVAFLTAARAEGLSTDGGDAQLVADAYIACAAARANGYLHQIAAVVREVDPHLAGGSPLLTDDADAPAVSLVWAANATLCP